jgi:hypothetical protein
MRAVIEMKDGNVQTRIGISGLFGAFVVEWLVDHPETERIWCVMDELGEEWDPESRPYWALGRGFA